MNLLNNKYSYVLLAVLLTGCGSSDETPTKEVGVNELSITSTANISATEDMEYSYQVNSVNANNPTYSLNFAP